jgi:hypothetical protein
MSDQEVGELWRAAMKRPSNNSVLIALIRKLVEERARWHEEKGLSDLISPRKRALHDFDIPESEWK